VKVLGVRLVDVMAMLKQSRCALYCRVFGLSHNALSFSSSGEYSAQSTALHGLVDQGHWQRTIRISNNDLVMFAQASMSLSQKWCSRVARTHLDAE
jgi:hypothetical protein